LELETVGGGGVGMATAWGALLQLKKEGEFLRSLGRGPTWGPRGGIWELSAGEKEKQAYVFEGEVGGERYFGALSVSSFEREGQC